MSKTTGGLLALAAFVLAGCPKAPEPKQLPPPPSIKSFAADKDRVEPGESVTLSFEAANATESVILDGSGKALEFEGDANGGTVTLTPTQTDVYVLKVTGEGGRATDFTRVAVGEDLKEVFLAAVPPQAKAGQQVDLLWSAQHATSAEITSSGDAEIPAIDPAEGAGVVTVTPERTQTFTLTASGAHSETPMTATATVVVEAEIDAFTATPQGASVGETVTLSWKTRGADEVVVSESLFGEQKRVSADTEPADVEAGSVDFTIPTNLPSGGMITDGQPLHFTLTVNQTEPAVTIKRELTIYVGAGPVIAALVAPDAVTEGHTLTVSWQTGNASKVQLFSNGQMVFETLSNETARAAAGSYELPPAGRDLDLKLVALNPAGASAEKSHSVVLVKAPKITKFQLPGQITNAGDPASASWTTQDATAVILRTQAGPTVFYTAEPAEVVSGDENLYPASNTTYVLEAFNAAGDKVTAEKVVLVQSPAQVTATPSPALPGTEVTLDWNLDSSTTAQVLGLPTPTPINDQNATDWLELDGHTSAREVPFPVSVQDDAIAKLPLEAPFHFPFVDGIRDDFWVSINGFVAFEDVGARPTNEDLTAGASPEIIAPLWDDLVLGTGKVFYVIDDSVSPRRLVIQWNGVATQSDPAASLTFQVQLEETGRFRFLYKSLSGIDSAGESATIGVNVRHGLFQSQIAFDSGGAILAGNTESTWFASASNSGTATYTLNETAQFGFFSVRQGGKYLFHSAPVWVFAPGSVLVTEAMPAPGLGAPAGRWIELYNAQNVPVDFGGLEVSTTAITQPLVLPPTFVPAHGFVLIGESGDKMQNGDLDMNAVWTDLSGLLNADTVQVQLLGSVLDSLSWSTVTENESVQPPEGGIDSAGAPIVCTRTETFGLGAIGTPGAANETCFEYSMTPIAGAFEDLSSSGTELLASASDYTGIGTFDLPATFTYFGEAQTQVNVSMVGFLTFGPPLTDAFEDNDAVPGTSEPNGVVAPFWDELVRLSSGHIWMARRSSYTIVSWQGFRFYGSSGEMNFQVKLFDSGVIEFHYGSITAPSGSRAPDASGASATTWIERLDGSGALPVNINTAGVIQPNTGYRFTPNP